MEAEEDDLLAQEEPQLVELAGGGRPAEDPQEAGLEAPQQAEEVEANVFHFLPVAEAEDDFIKFVDTERHH